MPTTLNTIPSTAITVRWKEPYASEALNRKFAVTMPAGVYRGLRLEISASDLSVDVAQDPTHGDHVAVFETEDGYSISYRDRISGRLTLDLSSFAISEVVTIAASAGYQVGVDTDAELQGYTQAEFTALTTSQRLGLVVLGTVVRSASGVIPVGNISHDGRDSSFLNRSSESVPWNPLIRNGGFELGEVGATFLNASPFWEVSTDNANFSYGPSDTGANTGDKSLELSCASVGACTAIASQVMHTSVLPGRQIRVVFYKRSLQAAGGGPTGVVRFSFEDKNGSLSDVDLSFDIDSVDGSFVDFDGVIVIPANMVVLNTVKVITSGSYSSTGTCHRLDDIQAWYEVDAEEWFILGNSLSGEMATDALFVGNRTIGVDAAKVSFDGADVVVESRDPAIAAPGLYIARIVAEPIVSAGIEYVLVWESIPSGAKGYRRYVTPSGVLVETVNAHWNNSTNVWAKDVSADRAQRFDLGESFTLYRYRIEGASTWGDASWEDGSGRDRFGAHDIGNWKQWTGVWLEDVATDGHWNDLNTFMVSAGTTELIGVPFQGIGIVRLDPYLANDSRLVSTYDGLEFTDDTIVILEMPIHVVEGGTDSLKFRVGWGDSANFFSLEEYAFISWDQSVSTSWNIEQGTDTGGGQESIPAAFAPTFPGTFLLRLELIGANHSEGYRVRGYVNGIFMAETTNVAPRPVSNMHFGVYAQSSAGISDDHIFVGNPSLSWKTVI